MRLQCAVPTTKISCPHYILDLTGHFQRIFQVEGGNSQQPPLEWKEVTLFCMVLRY